MTQIQTDIKSVAVELLLLMDFCFLVAEKFA